MPKKHIVQPGEHISGIAASHGFGHFASIWDDPANAQLKKLRENPHVLLPGDELTIPDFQVKVVNAETGKRHPFTVKVSRLMLRIQALDYGKKPIAATPCTFIVEGGKAPLETDGDGKVDAPIVKTARVASFKIGADEYAIQVGFLDPVKEEAEPGWAARLSNIGYFIPANPAERDEDELRSAVEEFQKDFGMKVDGKLSAATKAKLVQVHGS